MSLGRQAWLVVVVMSLGVLVNPLLGHAGASDDKTSMADVKQQTQELLHSLKAYTADQRDEAVHKAKAALDDLDKRIAALEARVRTHWDQMDEATRTKVTANLKELRERRTRLAAWYGELKTSSRDAWEDVKKGFSDAYRALDDVWEKTDQESRPKP